MRASCRRRQLHARIDAPRCRNLFATPHIVRISSRSYGCHARAHSDRLPTAMKIHEYQAKAILAKHGVPVPAGRSRCSTADDAAGVAERLGGGTVVVKAQIHAGGRGKGGGVKVVKRPAEAEATAREDPRHERSSPTRPARPGRWSSALLVEQGLQIERELYLGIVIDRATRAAGADGQPRRRRRDREGRRRDARADLQGVHPSRARPAARSRRASWRSRSASQGTRSARRVKLMMALYEAFIGDRRVAARDQPAHRHRRRRAARARRQDDFDDNALFRHPDIKELRDIERGRSARGRGVEVLAELHQARRHDRLHGQRRRPRDGDDGHHQAGGRRAGQLPRRRRRRQRRADQERLPHPDVRHGRQGGAHQHLRRHPALRRPRRRRDRRGQGARRAGADRDPHGRHERRAGQADAEGERPQLHDRRRR